MCGPRQSLRDPWRVLTANLPLATALRHYQKQEVKVAWGCRWGWEGQGVRQAGNGTPGIWSRVITALLWEEGEHDSPKFQVMFPGGSFSFGHIGREDPLFPAGCVGPCFVQTLPTLQPSPPPPPGFTSPPQPSSALRPSLSNCSPPTKLSSLLQQ